MFSKLKILDLSTVLAGPSVGTFFAELGAEVIKIESTNHPDVTRSWKLGSEIADSSVSAYFSSVNYGKKYTKLDLLNGSDREALNRLIETSDILLMNFKQSDYAKFQLENKALWKINPQLIIGKISGFGNDSDRVAYDLILQAETGFMSMNGTPSSGPVKMPVALIDVLAAHQLKEGLLVALIQRIQSQKGSEVSVSLYDAAVCSLVNQASNYLMQNHIPQRIGSLHPNIAPYGEIFTTKDGALITLAIGSNGHFSLLCELLQIPALISDKRFLTNQLRVSNRVVLFELLAIEISKSDSAEILQKSEELHIPIGKIKSLDEVFQSEVARALVREENIDGITTKRVASLAFQIRED